MSAIEKSSKVRTENGPLIQQVEEIVMTSVSGKNLEQILKIVEKGIGVNSRGFATKGRNKKLKGDEESNGTEVGEEE